MNTKEFSTLCVLLVIGIMTCFLPIPGEAVKLNEGYDPGAARTANNLSDLASTTTARSNLMVYSQEEVDNIAGDLEELLQQGSLRLYYVTATDTVTAGRKLSTTPQGVATSIAYAALSATTYTQVNNPPRVSDVGEPGVATLTAGSILTVRYMSTDQAVSTGRSVTGLNELWMVDADGSSNPTFVASSSEYILLGTEIQRVQADYTLAADVSTGGTTRRFQEKHFRKRTGILTGANPIVTVYYGGTNEGLFSAPVPSAVVMRTDGSNGDSTVALPGALTVAGTTSLNGVASAVKILGNPDVPVTSIDGKGGVDVWSPYFQLGADSVSNTRTNSSAKYAFLVMPHLLTAEQPSAIFTAVNSTPGNQLLTFGGGSNGLNSWEVVRFFTAANTTTLTGTERARFNNSGQFLLGTTTGATQSTCLFRTTRGAEVASLAIGLGEPGTDVLSVTGTASFSGTVDFNGTAEFMGTASAVKILGNPALDGGGASGTCALDIWGNTLNIGSELRANTRTAGSAKYANISVPGYGTATNVTILLAQPSSPENSVFLGGGVSNNYAATQVRFYTAASRTTLAGTERARFNSSGQLLLGTTTGATQSTCLFRTTGGAEVASLAIGLGEPGTDVLSVTGTASFSGNVRFGGAAITPEKAFTDLDATPDVTGGTSFVMDYSASATVTNFDGGIAGQIIVVRIFARGAGTTVTLDRTNARLAGSANLVVNPNTHAVISLVFDGTYWNEISRSNPNG